MAEPCFVEESAFELALAGVVVAPAEAEPVLEADEAEEAEVVDAYERERRG